MKFRPSTLIVMPIFFIEILLAPSLPLLGVVPPLSLIAISRMMFYLSTYHILWLSVAMGFLADVLVGVDRGALFIAFVAAGGVIAAAKHRAGERASLASHQLITALAASVVFEVIVLLFSPTIDWLNWLSYIKSMMIVALLTFVSLGFLQRILRGIYHG